MATQDMAAARELTVAVERQKRRAKMLLRLQGRDFVRNGVFRFCDLPAEIRNMVYGFALQRVGHLFIDVDYTRQPPRITFSTAPIFWKRSGLSASLLGVSPQIHEEAAPILYGANTFDFIDIARNTEQSLLDFLKRIGCCRQHLRRIHFPSLENAAVLRSALHLLKQATNLESFRCDAVAVYNAAKCSSYPNALLPFLKVLQKSSQAHKDRRSPLEVLTFDGPPAFPNHMPERVRLVEVIRWEADYSKLMAQLRAGLGLEKLTE
ncbi:hypothetical protein LTR10_003214 [Elasticomyces elasticus]|nr:hypothetical protein LTR10_003214 [Elasticomyces elasticus]